MRAPMRSPRSRRPARPRVPPEQTPSSSGIAPASCLDKSSNNRRSVVLLSEFLESTDRIPYPSVGFTAPLRPHQYFGYQIQAKNVRTRAFTESLYDSGLAYQLAGKSYNKHESPCETVPYNPHAQMGFNPTTPEICRAAVFPVFPDGILPQFARTAHPRSAQHLRAGPSYSKSTRSQCS